MKNFIIVLIILIINTPAIAFAIHSPLQTSDNSAYITQGDDVELLSFSAYLRVRKGFTSVNTSMVLHNTDSSSSASILVGIPNQFSRIMTVRYLTVTIGGQRQNISTLNEIQNPLNPSLSREYVNRWHTWTINLNPGEIKVIDCEFSLDNAFYNNGTIEIFFPITLIESWGGNIKNVQIIADLDFYPPYVFEPKPSVTPSQFDRGGRLTWRFNDAISLEDITLYFRPIDDIILNFFQSQLPNDKKISNIISLFRTKNFQSVIREINEIIIQEPSHMLKTELKMLKALSYQEIFDFNSALTIIDDIEEDFNRGIYFDDVYNTIRNKIVYDKIEILKRTDDDDKALEYINEIKPTIKNNDIFIMWLREEEIRLTPDSSNNHLKEDFESKNELAENDESNPDETTGDVIYVFQNINEFLILAGAVVIIIIIFLIFRHSTRKRKYFF